jgi:hypothetical protein
MGPVLLAVFMVIFVMIAPLKVVALTVAGFGSASLVVQATALSISGVKVTIAQAFKTIILSFLLSLLAGFTLVSFVRGAPHFMLNDITGLGALAFQYGAYVLAFRMGLGLTWLHAALVAVVSSTITGVCIWAAARLLA